MRRRITFLFLELRREKPVVHHFGSFLLIAADDPKDDAKAEMKKLEGTWTTVSSTFDGKKMPDEKAKVVKLTMKADGT
jgi:hypothetical protein